MTMWDDRLKDFPKRCIRNFFQFAALATEEGREVSLAIATCQALFIVLDKHFEILKGTGDWKGDNNLSITPDELDVLLKDCVPGWHMGKKQGYHGTGLRHSLAHFNIDLIAAGSEDKTIEGMILTSKPPSGKNWEGLVAANDLPVLIEKLQKRVWPDDPQTVAAGPPA
jgi:hypothetical protein